MATDYQASAGKSRVQGPAIGLIVAGVLSVLIGLYLAYSGVVFNPAAGRQQVQDALDKAKRDNPKITPAEEKQARDFGDASLAYSGPTSIVVGLIHIVLGGVTIAGALSMLNLKSPGMAMTGAIAAVIPCYCCWPLGLPFGIWAIVTLSQPAVKLAFQQARGERF